MVILLKNRAAIYQREATEMLHNISLYPGLTEDQLCRFFPEKEATAKTLLAHMLKEGRIFCAGNDRYYANSVGSRAAALRLRLCNAVHRQLCYLAEKRRYAGRYFSAVSFFVAAGLSQRYSVVSLQSVLHGGLHSNSRRDCPVSKTIQPRCLDRF